MFRCTGRVGVTKVSATYYHPDPQCHLLERHIVGVNKVSATYCYF